MTGRTRWGLILGVWTGYGLLTVAQQHVAYALNRGSTVSWLTSLLLQMPIAYTWALLTPAIVRWGRRYPFERSRWPLSAAIHVVTSCGLVFLVDVGTALYWSTILPQPQTRPLIMRATQLFAWFFASDVPLYWIILVIDHAARHQRSSRERELTESQLRTQLAQAELQALKMQLHPHFLFNALHTIGSLVRTGDQKSAVRIVAGLGELLRRMLDGGTQQEVPLRQELDFVRNYVEIERARFSDRLEVTIEADQAVLDAAVPHLILQPLVENAIRHGIAPHAWAGHLVISAQRIGDRLTLAVRDDGPGIAAHTGRDGPGIGLSNPRARLSLLYGSEYQLDVHDVVGGGLEARLIVPFRSMQHVSAPVSVA